MSDENTGTIGSVFTFGADIDTQEAPPPIPARKYLASITAAEAKVSKTSGNTYADISMTIAPDQFPPDFAQINPDAVTLHYRSLVMNDTARSRYQIRKFCEAIRLPVKREFDLNSLIGKACTVEVTHEPYQGEPRAQIRGVEPA